MNHLITSCCAALGVALPLFVLCPLSATAQAPTEFTEPVRLRAGDDFVKTESPGYASPCLADIDGDDTLELLVGQFNGGKIRVYEPVPGDETGTRFDEGRWLEADGEPARIPGVW